MQELTFFIHNLLFDSLNYFEAGGIIMFPLAAISLIIWYLIIERYMFLKKSKPHNILKAGNNTALLESEFNKNINLLKALTSTAPLLGLLGTVFGLISIFDIISVLGNNDSSMMSSGISEALITTETGLIIAIPGYLFSSYYKYKAEKIRLAL